MRLRLLVVSLIALALSTGTGYAQTFTGTVDGYWSYNSNTPDNPVGSHTNSYRAFDFRDQTFSLNYGELAVDYKPNDIGVRVDIGFGDAADAVHAFEPAGQNLWRHIQQAYITASKGKLTVDFGKFVTTHGAEVIETKDNWNYTRGLLFTWAIPYYHFGGRATYVANDKVSLGGYVVNGWNNVKDNNTAKSVGFVGVFKPHAKITLAQNYLVGKEKAGSDDIRQMYDGVSTINVVDSLTLMGNYDYGMDRLSPIFPATSGARAIWQGAAGYLKWKNDHLALVSRYEWFDDRQGFMTGIAQQLESWTGTAQIPWSDLTLWAEFRRDWSDQSTFAKTEPGVFGPVQSFVDHQNTFTLGVTYAFTKMVK